MRASAGEAVVLVIGGLQAGGAERQLAELANALDARGYEVTLATWSSPASPDFYALAPGVRRVWLDTTASNRRAWRRWTGLLRQVVRLRRLLREVQPIAVLSFIDVSNVLTLLATSALGLRVVIAERTSPAVNHNVRQPWRLLRRLCYSWADVVVAQTRDAARWLEQNCRTRVTVIPNSLRPMPLLERERELLIVAVGRLDREKAFDQLIRAFARLSADFPQWRVAILGTGPEQDTLAGQVQDVEVWMARAGLLVHPSRREGFPNVVLEAMGMGAAVICTDCRSGPAELIRDGINGRLVPVDDLECLVRVMRDLLGDPTARGRLGSAARAVRSDYASDRILQLWEACLLPQRGVTG